MEDNMNPVRVPKMVRGFNVDEGNDDDETHTVQRIDEEKTSGGRIVRNGGIIVKERKRTHAKPTLAELGKQVSEFSSLMAQFVVPLTNGTDSMFSQPYDNNNIECPPNYHDASQTDVKLPYSRGSSDSSDSVSDADEDDEGTLTQDEIRSLKKAIENLQSDQDQLKKMQEVHDMHLRALLEQQPNVNKSLKHLQEEYRRRSTCYFEGQEASANMTKCFEKLQQLLRDDQLYVQLEQLYTNLHVLRFPTKTVEAVLDNNRAVSYYNVDQLAALTSNETENSALKKRIAELETRLKDMEKGTEELRKQRTPGSSPLNNSILEVPRMANGDQKTDLSHDARKRFVAGRPTLPTPMPPFCEPTVTETTFTWTIYDYERKLHREKYNGDPQLSQPIYLTHNGYRAQIETYLNGNGTATNKCMSVFLRIIKGDYDHLLKWPVNLHLVVILVNQASIQKESLKASGNQFQFSRPTGETSNDSDCWGLIEFVSHQLTQTRQFIRNDKIMLKCRVTFMN